TFESVSFKPLLIRPMDFALGESNLLIYDAIHSTDTLVCETTGRQRIMLGYAITFIISIFVSTLLTWFVRNVAGRYGLLQAPISSRHVHIRPIPRLGGVAIFATFILVYGMYSAASAHGLTRPAGNGDLLKIVLLSTCMFLVGVADDFLGMTAWSKLIVQISAGLGLFYSGIRFNFCYTHIAGSWTNVVCLIATFLWVLLICNAINLIDGLDGLAAGAALFSMVTIFTLALGNRPG